MSVFPGNQSTRCVGCGVGDGGDGDGGRHGRGDDGDGDGNGNDGSGCEGSQIGVHSFNSQLTH